MLAGTSDYCCKQNKRDFPSSFTMSYCHWWKTTLFKVWIFRNSSDTALYIMTQHKSNTGGGDFPVILSESITQPAHHGTFIPWFYMMVSFCPKWYNKLVSTFIRNSFLVYFAKHFFVGVCWSSFLFTKSEVDIQLSMSDMPVLVKLLRSLRNIDAFYIP